MTGDSTSPGRWYKKFCETSHCEDGDIGASYINGMPVQVWNGKKWEAMEPPKEWRGECYYREAPEHAYKVLRLPIEVDLEDGEILTGEIFTTHVVEINLDENGAISSGRLVAVDDEIED